MCYQDSFWKKFGNFLYLDERGIKFPIVLKSKPPLYFYQNRPMVPHPGEKGWLCIRAQGSFNVHIELLETYFEKILMICKIQNENK